MYNGPLEKQPEYNGFDDFVKTLLLRLQDDPVEVVGELTTAFRMYMLPEDPDAGLPPKILEKPSQPIAPIECLVRVYVVRACDLAAADPNGLFDPYIVLEIGDLNMDNRKEYIANTLNSVFGRYLLFSLVLCFKSISYELMT